MKWHEQVNQIKDCSSAAGNNHHSVIHKLQIAEGEFYFYSLLFIQVLLVKLQ